jgi:hypothetical protein
MKMNMKTSRKHLVCVVGAALSAAAPVLCLASTAQAETAQTWAPDTYQRPTRLTPRPLTEPEGPALSWDPLRFGLALETQTTWLRDSAARRLVGKGVPTAAGLSLHYEALRPTPRLIAKLDLGWATSSTSVAQPTDSATMENFDTNMVTLGVSMRYQVFRWLAPYARLAGGVGWDKLSVGSGSGNLHDEHTFGHAAAGGGVFLRSPALCSRPSSSYCAAIMGHIEGGYLVGSGSTWSLHSSPAPGVSDPVPTASVPVGEMDRRAPYLRISLGIAL